MHTTVGSLMVTITNLPWEAQWRLLMPSGRWSTLCCSRLPMILSFMANDLLGYWKCLSLPKYQVYWSSDRSVDTYGCCIGAAPGEAFWVYVEREDDTRPIVHTFHYERSQQNARNWNPSHHSGITRGGRREQLPPPPGTAGEGHKTASPNMFNDYQT